MKRGRHSARGHSLPRAESFNPHRRTLRRRIPTVFGLISLLSTLAFLSGQITALGGFSAEAGGNGTYRSGTLLLSDTIGGTNCLSAPNAAASITTANSANCTTHPMGSSPGSTTTTLGNQGSITPTSANVSQSGTCGVQELIDASSAGTNTALPDGGISFATAGPTSLSGSVSASFASATTGYAETLTQKPSPGPETFSIAAWFKTTSASGSIIGYSNAQDASGATVGDRFLWMDAVGNLVFGLYPGSAYELASSAGTYANGAWHYVVVTVVATSSTKATVEMYIDGALVAGSTNDETITGSDPADAYGGWWQLGWSAVSTSYANYPSNNYWNGSLADMVVFPSNLSAAQVAALYGQTSQAALSSAVLADSATSFWPLQDTGSTLYSGSIADLANSSAVGTFPDESGSAATPNTGIAQGQLGQDSSGPIGTTGTTFDGTTGYIETSNQIASPGPQTYSLAAWFKTTIEAGSVISFESSQGTSAASWDRMIWMDSSGHLVFGFGLSGLPEITSPSTYGNGGWHYVVVTVNVTSATSATYKMYVDGTQVVTATRAIISSDSSQAYAGYWHLGWSNITSSLKAWADKPSNGYWQGSLGQVTVFPTVLTAANVSTLYGESNDASYATAITAPYGGSAPVASASYYWPLDGAPQYGDYSANPGNNYGTGFGVEGSDPSGPFAGATATTFDGSTTYVETNTQSASPGPQTYSIAAWFKTTTASGSIIGYANSQSLGSPVSADRMLWLDPAGCVIWGLFPVSYYELASPVGISYANGAWHFVVVTVTPTSSTTGTVLMYIDGSLVAGSTNDETITGSDTSSSYAGYWHLGWSRAFDWTGEDPPTGAFWKGSLGQVAVFPAVLSASQVSTLHGETSSSAYQLAVTGGVATSSDYWPLNDWPASLTVSPACTYVGLTVQAGTSTTSCVYPAIDATCPSSPPVTAWPVPAIGSMSVPFTNLTYNTSVTLGAVTVPPSAVGLHVAVGPVTISDSGGGFTATLVHPLGNVGYVIL
jgi:hypothetical protein